MEPLQGAGGGRTRRAVVLIGDLLIGSRVRDTLRRLGIEADFVPSPAQLEDAVSLPASILIIDLGESRFEPIGVIGAARARGIRVLAFGSHVDAAGLQAAREAGADRVVPRSAFASGHAGLIEELTGQDGRG